MSLEQNATNNFPVRHTRQTFSVDYRHYHTACRALFLGIRLADSNVCVSAAESRTDLTRYMRRYSLCSRASTSRMLIALHHLLCRTPTTKFLAYLPGTLDIYEYCLKERHRRSPQGGWRVCVLGGWVGSPARDHLTCLPICDRQIPLCRSHHTAILFHWKMPPHPAA